MKYKFIKKLRIEAHQKIGIKNSMSMSKHNWITYAIWLEDKLCELSEKQ